MKLSLHRNFVLRQSKSESLLQDLQTGANYPLESDQAEFIRFLDGTKTRSEILGDYDEGSHIVITNFLEKLSGLGAISTDGLERVFYEPVPDLRLEAVHFEPSGVCNMRCAHCYQGSHVKNSLTLPESFVERVLDEMLRLQVSSVSVSGGEPLMMPNLEHLLRNIECRDIYISALFTNGLLIDDKTIRMLSSLRKKPPLYISLDSLPGEQFMFRGFPSKTAKRVLEKIVAGISSLVQAGFRVTVNTVINAENINILERMHDLMLSIGVFNWRLGFPKMTPNFKDHLQFSADWNMIAERCFSILQKHFEKGQPFPLQVEYMYRDVLFEQGLPNLTPEDYVCDYEGRRHEVNIKPNGDVVSCAYCNELPIGNIGKSSLWDIWYSAEMQKVKSVKIKGVRDCQGCELIPLCGTGCRANAFFLHGDFFNSRDDYACHAVKFFRDRVRSFLQKQGVIKN